MHLIEQRRQCCLACRIEHEIRPILTRAFGRLVNQAAKFRPDTHVESRTNSYTFIEVPQPSKPEYKPPFDEVFHDKSDDPDI